MERPPSVSPPEWQAARDKLLVEEKEHTRARDALAADGAAYRGWQSRSPTASRGRAGPASLLDLFEGRRQLVVYRFFYEPEVMTYAQGGSYPERACVGCSFLADQLRTALGRQQEWEDSPEGYPQTAPYMWWTTATRTPDGGTRNKRTSRGARSRRKPGLPATTAEAIPGSAGDDVPDAS